MSNDNGRAVDPIDAAIQPLREARDQLVAERESEVSRLSAELAAAKARGAEEIKRLDRILRAAEPRHRTKRTPTTDPGHWISAAMVEQARTALGGLSGEFTVVHLQEEMAVAEATARKAIRVLLVEGDLVKVGHRPGSKATYYAKVDG